jgi:hypothetical protein
MKKIKKTKKNQYVVKTYNNKNKNNIIGIADETNEMYKERLLFIEKLEKYKKIIQNSNNKNKNKNKINEEIKKLTKKKIEILSKVFLFHKYYQCKYSPMIEKIIQNIYY